MFKVISLSGQEECFKLKVWHVDNLTRGMSSWPRPADHRSRWPSMLVTGLQISRSHVVRTRWHL